MEEWWQFPVDCESYSSYIMLFSAHTACIDHFALLLLTVLCLLCLAGMEVAAALTDKAHSVSVIGVESVPFKTALGEKVGKAIMKVGKHSWEIKLRV